MKKVIALLISLALLLSLSIPAMAAEKIKTVASAQDLLDFIEQVNGGEDFEGETVSLAADIDMTGVDFTPAGNYLYDPMSGFSSGSTVFAGTFEGNEHTISGLTAEKDAASADPELLALFGSVGKKGTIRNLTLSDADLTGLNVVAGIAGYSCGLIENCHVTDSVIYSEEMTGDVFDTSSSGAGGICGFNFGTVYNCTVNELKLYRGGSNLGGICGFNSGLISECTAFTVELTNGITTQPMSWISNGNIGGICGNCAYLYDSDNPKIESCINFSDISVERGAGGICGYLNGGAIVNCVNYGDIDVSARWAGGIVGSCWMTVPDLAVSIEYCRNFGDITGGDRSGGICGDTSFMTSQSDNLIRIDCCLNQGSVTGTGLIGGICGKCDAAVESCFNTGAVTVVDEPEEEETATNATPNRTAGGICGTSNSSVAYCGNSGNISALLEADPTLLFLGGISGQSFYTTENCYNAGSVSSNIDPALWEENNIFLGGIIGMMRVAILPENCYFSITKPTQVIYPVANFTDVEEGGVELDDMYGKNAEASMPALFGENTAFTAPADFEEDGHLYTTLPFIEAAAMDRYHLAKDITPEPEPEPEPTVNTADPVIWAALTAMISLAGGAWLIRRKKSI